MTPPRITPTATAAEPIRLTLPYPPATNRMYRNVNGRTLLSAEARKYKADVERIARLCKARPIDGPVCLTIHVIRPRRSGDLDGRLKAALDCLQGVCYANDNQITEIHAFRLDDRDNPRVEVVVEAAQ